MRGCSVQAGGLEETFVTDLSAAAWMKVLADCAPGPGRRAADRSEATSRAWFPCLVFHIFAELVYSHGRGCHQAPDMIVDPGDAALTGSGTKATGAQPFTATSCAWRRRV
jgi:hypothetical protein